MIFFLCFSEKDWFYRQNTTLHIFDNGDQMKIADLDVLLLNFASKLLYAPVSFFCVAQGCLTAYFWECFEHSQCMLFVASML